MTKGRLEIMASGCNFDKKDGCHALACYSHEKCNSRDEHGNPMYVSTEIIKKEMKYKR